MIGRNHHISCLRGAYSPRATSSVMKWSHKQMKNDNCGLCYQGEQQYVILGGRLMGPCPSLGVRKGFPEVMIDLQLENESFKREQGLHWQKGDVCSGPRETRCSVFMEPKESNEGQWRDGEMSRSRKRERGGGRTIQCLLGCVQGFGLTLKAKPLERGVGHLMKSVSPQSLSYTRPFWVTENVLEEGRRGKHWLCGINFSFDKWVITMWQALFQVLGSGRWTRNLLISPHKASSLRCDLRYGNNRLSKECIAIDIKQPKNSVGCTQIK